MIKNKLWKCSKEKGFFFSPVGPAERMDSGWRAFVCKVSISNFVHMRITDV